MTQYSGFDLSTLPKRVTSSVNLDDARALLAQINKDGGASDMAKFDTAEAARNAGLRAKRLVEHVMPTGKRATIRTFGLDKAGKPTNADPVSYGWVVALKDAKAAKAGDAS